jgi:POT family proton-dependent oligopeptide transporter
VGWILGVPVIAFFLQNNVLFSMALPIIGLLAASYLMYQAVISTPKERNQLFVIFALMFFQATFFSLFEQAGSSLSLFTDRLVDRTLWGVTIPASQYQSLNPFFIMTLGPLFAILWAKLSVRGLNPSPPLKFIYALLTVALGFVVLLFGMKYPSASGFISPIWIVLAYLLHTVGELCLSPIGLSMVTSLSPARIMSTVMGIWMLSLAFAQYLAGFFSKLDALPDVPEGAQINMREAVQIYASAFEIVTWFSLGAMIVLIFLYWPLRRPFLRG